MAALGRSAASAVTIAALLSTFVSCTEKGSRPGAAETEPWPPPLTGPASRPAEDYLRSALAARKATGSFRVRGTTFVLTTTLDVEARRDSRGTCAGTLSHDKGSLQFVATRKANYIKGRRAFWNERSEYGEDLNRRAGLWLKMPTDKSIANVCNLTDKLDRYDQALAHLTVLYVGAYEGRDAAFLAAKEAGNIALQLYVDVEEPHHLLGFEDRSGKYGILKYSDFGKVPLIRVPTDDELYEPGDPIAPPPGVLS